MNECRKFRVEGRVQGVWFRESTRQQAVKLGLSGYAINRRDGSVEVLACGGSEGVSRLAAWLHRGPPMAEVESVTALDCDDECPDRFTTG